MDRERATRLLSSVRQNERLSAARYLLAHATADGLEVLRRALKKEKVSWIRNALKEAADRALIPRSTATGEGGTGGPEQDAVDANDVHSEAVRQTTGQIIHEIEPILGMLRIAARSEINEFDQSKTKRYLDQLSRLLEALAELRRAACAPRIDEFNLHQLLEHIADAELQKCAKNGLRVEWGGRKPFLLQTDRTLISIIISNGLRNALEATAILENEDMLPILVTWGETDKEYWISIVDGGMGFAGSIERIFDLGTSSKPGNLGMGLPTARQAAASLGGSGEVISRDHNGARFELRWPRPAHIGAKQ